jgi:hypothetical protein
MTSNDIYIPFTYCITFIPAGQRYYGVRYGKGCHPDQLWTTYFTSSKTIKILIEEHGKDSFSTQIRKTFEGSLSARIWESRFLKKINASRNSGWLNKTDNISISPSYGNDNRSSTPEVQAKISATLLKYYETNPHCMKGRVGHVGSDKQKKAVAKSNSERIWSSESLLKLSEGQTGLKKPPLSENHKQQISDFHSGRPKKQVQCPHCCVIGGINTMGRWHFDNCKHFCKEEDCST